MIPYYCDVDPEPDWVSIGYCKSCFNPCYYACTEDKHLLGVSCFCDGEFKRGIPVINPLRIGIGVVLFCLGLTLASVIFKQAMGCLAMITVFSIQAYFEGLTRGHVELVLFVEKYDL